MTVFAFEIPVGWLLWLFLWCRGWRWFLRRRYRPSGGDNGPDIARDIPDGAWWSAEGSLHGGVHPLEAVLDDEVAGQVKTDGGHGYDKFLRSFRWLPG